MHKKLKQYLFAFELLGRRLGVNKLVSVDTTLHLLGIKQVLKGGKVPHVTSHVSRKNNPNHPLAECFKVVARVFCHEVVLGCVENSERLGDMVVLLHGFVAVAHSSWRNSVHMVRVVQAIMVVVMAHRGNYRGQNVKLIELRKLKQSSLGKHHVKHLDHVCSMDVIVVFDFPLVAFIDLSQKLPKDRLV